MLHLIKQRSRKATIIAFVVIDIILVAGLILYLTAFAPFAGAQPAPSAAAQKPITYVYISTGGDTLGTEVISHEGTGVAGILSIKGQPRIEWVQAHQNRKPGVLTLRVFAPDAAADASPLQSGTAESRGDSVFVDFTGGSQQIKQAIASKAGALPLVNASVLHASLLASYARQAKLASVDLFLTSGARTVEGVVTVLGDTTVFTLANSEMHIVAGADGLPSLITLPGQSARVVRAGGSGAGAGTPTDSPGNASLVNYDAPANAPYTARHIRIPSGRGYELAATLTVPKGVTKSPVVVTISGSGPQERDSRISVVPGYEIFRQIADTLGRRGIATLRFDDRAVGESGGREGAAQATSADAADDVRAIVSWLRVQPEIDGNRIALAGHSEGGMIAPMIAATDSQLKAVALLAGPAYTGRRVIMFQNRQAIDAAPGLTTQQRDSIYATVPAQLDSAGKKTPWIGYFMAHDPVITARLVKQPVLILQGATDKQVTAEQADTLAAAFRSNGNRDVTERTFPETNHLFLKDASGVPAHYAELPDPKVRAMVLGALADWAVRVLK